MYSGDGHDFTEETETTVIENDTEAKKALRNCLG